MSIATSARDTCSSCGGAWFGNVAYCPYCGHASGFAPALDLVPAVDFDPFARAADDGPAREHAVHASPAGTRRSGLKPMALLTIVGCIVIAAGVLAVGRFAGTAGDRAPPPAPVRAQVTDVARTAVPRAAAEPLAQQPAARPAAPPPAPNRALCSVANEAAGLCRAQ